MYKKSRKNHYHSKLILEELEPRVLFSGGAEALLAPPLTHPVAAYIDVNHQLEPIKISQPPLVITEPNPQDAATLESNLVNNNNPHQQQSSHEYVFVDPRVNNYQALVDDLQQQKQSGKQMDVVLLDTTKDGIQQIADALQGQTQISAIHLIAEGASAELHLGSSFLTQNSLVNQYANQLQVIGQHLSADADLLIYGCNYGQGASGQTALQTLANLTGADVAASTNRTGSISEFGDWTLETSTGPIETTIAVSEQTQQTWQGALATYTVINTNDSGAGSLRQAIDDANANAGTDNIDFTIFGTGIHTITLSTMLPDITSAVNIDATTDDSFAANSNQPAIVLNGQGTILDGLRLYNGSDGSSIRGLVIQNFTQDGIDIAFSNSNTVAGNWIGLNSAGTGGAGNQQGVNIWNSNNNIIGGSSVSDRNILSANSGLGIFIGGGATGNQIRGNYIGTNAAGTAAVGNLNSGIYVDSAGNTIGGSIAGYRNVISGSVNFEGIRLSVTAPNTIISGNYIGLNAAGTAAIANAGAGIFSYSSNNIIGGTTAAERNVIAGNQNGIIFDGTTAATGNQIIGNYVGTDFLGNTAIANTLDGIILQNGATNNTVGGSNVNQRNIVGGNGEDGIQVNGEASDSNIVKGNWVGLAANGSTVLANGRNGILVTNGSDSTIIGGSGTNDGNTVVGAVYAGLEIWGASTGTIIRGNNFGTDTAGSLSGGNQHGIYIGNGAGSTLIGGTGTRDGNTIANSSVGDGIYIDTTASNGNVLLGNRIWNNALLGINLNGGSENGSFVTANDLGDGDSGANGLQNFPVLTSAIAANGSTTIVGNLNSTASTSFRIEFFSSPAGSEDASGYGEGQTYLGATTVTTDGSGNAPINVLLSGVSIAANDRVTATATVYSGNDSYGGTSEFAMNVITTQSNTAPVFSAGTGLAGTDIRATAMDFINDAAIQSDGKIVAVGYSNLAGKKDFAIARYNEDGSLDTSFGGGTGKVITTIGSSDDIAQSVKILPDGKILVIGSSFSSSFKIAMLQYNADGSVDTSYGGGDGMVIDSQSLGDQIVSAAIQTDGKLLVASSYSNDFFVTRFNSDGSLDTGFGSGGSTTTDFSGGGDRSSSIAIQPDGKIVLGGYAFNGTSFDFAIARYNSDGTSDTSFNGTGKAITDLGTTSADFGYSVTVQPDGKLLVAGWTDAAGSNDFGLVRYNSNGSLDTSFNTTGKVTTSFSAGGDLALSVTVQSDGKVLVAGQSGSNGNNFAVARYNTDGSLDNTFNGTGKVDTEFTTSGSSDDRGAVVTIDASGKIIVLGTSTKSGNYDFAIARYNSNGSLDTRLNLANTLDSAPSYTENGAAVVLDGNVQIYDTELSATNYNGATLTLARNGGANAQDLFFATSTLGALTQGGNLSVGATIIGTVTTNSGGTLLLTFNSNATNALVNSALQKIAYSNSSDAPSASAQINWAFSDGNTGLQGTGGALTANGSTTVTITAINDAPALTSSTGTLPYAENTGPVIIGGTATISDPDSADLNGGQLVIQISANGLPEDTLTIQNQGNGVGQIGVSGVNISYGGVLVASFNGPVTGSTALTITFNSNATAAIAQAIMRNLSYQNSSEDPSTATRSLSATITDGDGGTSNTVVGYIAPSKVNDAPHVTWNGTYLLSTDENTASTSVAVSTVIVNGTSGSVGWSDIDSGALMGMAVIAKTGNGNWQYSTNGSTWVNFGTVSSTNALLLEGNTQIRYLPDGLYAEAAQLQIRAWDQTTDVASSNSVPAFGDATLTGFDHAYSNEIATVDATVTAVNDAPINILPAVQNTNENANLTFSSSNGNQISINDVDAASNPVAVTLSVTNGTLTLAGTTGLTFSTGDGSTDNSMSFSGTVIDINTALNGLFYTPATNYSGNATLTLTTIDSTLLNLNIDASLKGHYTFENTGALATDTSPATGFSGTVTGNPTSDADSTRGNVLGLDGNSSVQINGHFGNPANVTLAAWINSTALDANGSIIISMSGAQIKLGPSGALEGWLYSTTNGWTGPAFSGAGNLSDSSWHHVAFSFDDTTNAYTLYLDGENVASGTTIASISYNLDPDSVIGTGSIANFTGKIDDARIYNRALTDTEVATLASDLGMRADSNLAITVNAINDVPTLVSAILTLNEGQTVTLTDANFAVTDPDNNSFTYTVSALTGGYFQLSSNAGNPVTTFSTADLTGGLVQFVHDGNEAAPGFDVKVNDGIADSNSLAATVTYTPVNDSPIVTTTITTTNYTENGLPIIVDAGLTISDTDSNTLAGATVQIHPLSYHSGEDVLSFTDQLGITGSWNSTTGVLTLSGSATIADYQTALSAVTYSNTSEAPSTSVRSIFFSVDDGSLSSVANSRDINVFHVNDAPTSSPVTLSAIAEHSGARLITQAELLVNSTDLDTSSLTATGLVIASGAGSLLDNGAGTWTYTPALIDDSAVSFSYSVSDGSLSTAGSATLDITPINDVPVLNGVNLTVTQGETVTLSSQNFAAFDPDSHNFTYTLSQITGGYFKLGNQPGLAITSYSSQDLDNGLVQFVQDNGNVAPSFNLTINDGALNSNTIAANITFNAITQLPITNVPDAQSVLEETKSGIVGISIADPAHSDDVFTVHLQVASGKLNIVLSGSALISAGADDSADLTLQGTVAEINASLQSLFYTGNTDITGNNADNLSITTTNINHPGASNATIAITIINVNDVAVIGGTDAASVTEDTNVLNNFLHGSGQLTITDADVNEAAFVPTNVTGKFGTLQIGTTGFWTYQADNYQQGIQQLDHSQSVQDILTVTSLDGTQHNISISIQGKDDAPVISGETTGKASQNSSSVISGKLTVTPVDSLGNLVYFPNVSPTASDYGYGSFSMKDNVWTYQLQTDQAQIKNLKTGETLTDTFTFIASNGSIETITITIVGENNTVLVGPTTPTVQDTGATTDLVVPKSPTIIDNTNSTPTSQSQGVKVTECKNQVIITDLKAHIEKLLGDMSINHNNQYEVAGSGEKMIDLKESSIPSKTKFNYNEQKLGLDLSKNVNNLFDNEHLEPVLDDNLFNDYINQITQQIHHTQNQSAQTKPIEVELLLGSTISITAGVVGWTLRSGALLASFLSTVPLLNRFDPLPILKSTQKLKIIGRKQMGNDDLMLAEQEAVTVSVSENESS